ncbi:MAG: hypothetical protein A2X13_10160 [Bacteroidetes bacterium GWC2_33_15]|nr:MAG: hypothetical protein A2X10_02715 [Bacteroidetes bacterium GWA2_33_15]OFX48770.1 MAG: hypothetical protein A2X13_10160 [Bacteroidetes bacterium GWC2_33_15]OFX66012.1 MAG: hypothetical protein A2X15_11310 [Bacteroidetes bacterium GWB2_32_14]OFX68227.1 MAG: hypothetical protein A2X14_07585 [Bacteroidetes bacterium GWD2_33_33]HAN18004.1 hypothetical protein [Bacteroidales bacterium]
MNSFKNIFFFTLFCVISYHTSYTQEKISFPYHLNYSTDILLLSGGISLALSYQYLNNSETIRYLSQNEILKLDRNQINSFDRSATNYWSTELEKTSDYIRDGLQTIPALLVIPVIENKSWNNLFTLGIMYIEGYLINSGLTNTTKLIVQRKRPYLYNTNISDDMRIELGAEEGSYKSFFSGHTSGSFYNAVFISKVFTDIYGKNTWTYLLWGISLSAASTTGYLRYKSGYHYPTDILVGAIVGSVAGYFVPVLHKSANNKLSVIIKPNNQYGIAYTF